MLSDPFASFGLPFNVLVWQVVFFTLLSFGVGIIGGAVGLILGTLRVPAFIVILNLDPCIAAGSNLVIGFLMGGFKYGRQLALSILIK